MFHAAYTQRAVRHAFENIAKRFEMTGEFNEAVSQTVAIDR